MTEAPLCSPAQLLHSWRRCLSESQFAHFAADISEPREQIDRITEEALQLSHGVVMSIRKELGHATDSKASLVATS